MTPATGISRRRRPPLHWKYAVSLRKRWHRLRRLWRADREVEDCQYFGAKFRVAPTDVIGREMILQRFEWLQIPAMLRACRELNPAAFIDIGANFGLYTCIIGRQGLAKRLIAFEPNRWALGRLHSHIKLNQLTGVEVHDCAVGTARHAAVLLPGAPGCSALSTIVQSHPDAYEIQVVSLDELFSFVDEPLIIKIDVEGYELQVIEGAKRLLCQNYGYAQIESFETHRAASVIDKMSHSGWRLTDHIVDDLVFRRGINS